MQPVQLKMARAALDLSIDQLAARAGVSHVDIARLEDGTDGDDSHTARVRAVLESEGIVWIDEDGVRFTGDHAADAAVPVEELTTGNDGGIS